MKKKRKKDMLADEVEGQQSQLSQGIAETEEQIQDVYAAGNNDLTFLRDGKDIAEKTKK